MTIMRVQDNILQDIEIEDSDEETLNYKYTKTDLGTSLTKVIELELYEMSKVNHK
jgi:hypothetical protein